MRYVAPSQSASNKECGRRLNPKHGERTRSVRQQDEDKSKSVPQKVSLRRIWPSQSGLSWLRQCRPKEERHGGENPINRRHPPQPQVRQPLPPNQPKVRRRSARDKRSKHQPLNVRHRDRQKNSSKTQTRLRKFIPNSRRNSRISSGSSGQKVSFAAKKLTFVALTMRCTGAILAGMRTA